MCVLIFGCSDLTFEPNMCNTDLPRIANCRKKRKKHLYFTLCWIYCSCTVDKKGCFGGYFDRFFGEYDVEHMFNVSLGIMATARWTHNGYYDAYFGENMTILFFPWQ